MCNNYLLWLRAVSFFCVFKNLRHELFFKVKSLFITVRNVFGTTLEKIFIQFLRVLCFSVTLMSLYFCLTPWVQMRTCIYTIIEGNEIKRGWH